MSFRSCLSVCALSLLLAGCVHSGTGTATDNFSSSSQQIDTPRQPSLVVTDMPAPDVIYRPSARDTVLAGGNSNMMSEVMQIRSGFGMETAVTRKAAELEAELEAIKASTKSYADRLRTLQVNSDAAAARYYELVAAIHTELQSGSTPGNPVLIQRWNIAQDRLQDLSNTSSGLNALATDLAAESSRASFLQENVRNAYNLSGAVKSDHDRLRKIEDGASQNLVLLNRLLTSTSDEINRRQAYLRTEKANLQTLSLAVTNGELYGQNLSNSLYRRATTSGEGIAQTAPANQNRRPLVIIRFDRPNVNYEQALYNAVGQALERYPTAAFDLVAVSPTQGTAAELALASTEARKNGEAVLRSLVHMGLPAERINLSAASAADVRNSEVQLYLK